MYWNIGEGCMKYSSLQVCFVITLYKKIKFTLWGRGRCKGHPSWGGSMGHSLYSCKFPSNRRIWEAPEVQYFLGGLPHVFLKRYGVLAPIKIILPELFLECFFFTQVYTYLLRASILHKAVFYHLFWGPPRGPPPPRHCCLLLFSMCNEDMHSSNVTLDRGECSCHQCNSPDPRTPSPLLQVWVPAAYMWSTRSCRDNCNSKGLCTNSLCCHLMPFTFSTLSSHFIKAPRPILPFTEKNSPTSFQNVLWCKQRIYMGELTQN